MSNNEEVLKNLGLQEMLISPDFADFTRWFCGLTDENCLNKEEIVKINELKSNGTFVDDIDSINERIDGSSLTDAGEIKELQDEYDDLKDAEKAFEDMLITARGTELRMDKEINESSSEIRDSLMNVESLTQNCQRDAQFLEDLCTRNIENRSNLLTSFSSQLSSPLRWCRLNYERYFVDSDNTRLSIKLFFERTLKLRDNSSFVENDHEYMKCLYDLYSNQNTFARTALSLHEVETTSCQINALIDTLSKPLQPMNYGLMSEQTERLTWQNVEIEENLENLESMIQEKIAQLGYQEAKFCELANNREKMAAAEKRLDSMKKCAASAAEHLLLSELLFLLLNLEKETTENALKSVVTAHYEEEYEQCARNLEILAKISSESTADHVEEDFAKQVAEIIKDDVVADGTTSDEFDDPVGKYAERINHSAVQLKDVISDSYQINIVDLVKDFNGMSAHLNAFIGNGPSVKPNIWNLPVLAESEILKRKFDHMFDLSRTMRHDFMEKYHQPFTSDELFMRRQLLWIWFLTDQKTFLEAFQTTVENSKLAGGIQRGK